MCFVVFYVFSFPPAVYVGTLNLIASIPGLSILTLLGADGAQSDQIVPCYWIRPYNYLPIHIK